MNSSVIMLIILFNSPTNYTICLLNRSLEEWESEVDFFYLHRVKLLWPHIGYCEWCMGHVYCSAD